MLCNIFLLLIAWTFKSSFCADLFFYFPTFKFLIHTPKCPPRIMDLPLFLLFKVIFNIPQLSSLPSPPSSIPNFFMGCGRGPYALGLVKRNSQYLFSSKDALWFLKIYLSDKQICVKKYYSNYKKIYIF